MARLLNATGFCSSVLAAVCLVLALIAAPIGEVRADNPDRDQNPILCGATANPGLCQNLPIADCDPPNCNGFTQCKCKWQTMELKCGCFPN